MFNRNRNAASKSHGNDGYTDDDEDKDKKGREESNFGYMSDSSSIRDDVNYDDVADFIQVFDTQDEQIRSGSQPTITVSSPDATSKPPLEGIPEEIHSTNIAKRLPSSSGSALETKDTVNLGYDDMSLSNFKMIQGVDRSDRSDDKAKLKRDESYGSVIKIKDIHPDSHVHTGLNFRKASTFLISPKVSTCVHPDYMMYNAGDEKYGIKLIESQNVPELFIEFDCLQFNQVNQKYCWVEKSRWLRYEEYYNHDLHRFDSPHLSPLSIKGISKFRKLFAKGDAILDCHEEEFSDILKNVCDSINKSGIFSSSEMFDIRNALVLRHYHAGELMSNCNSYTTMYRFDNETQTFQQHRDGPANSRRSLSASIKYDNNQRKPSQTRLDGRLEPGTEALSVQVGALDSLEHTFSVFVRLDPPVKADGLNEVNCPLRFMFIVFGPKSKEEDLFEIGRVFAVMMSNIAFREVGYSARRKEDIIDASKNFINQSVLVPLNKVITHETLAAMLPQMKLYANNFYTEQNKRLFDEIRKDITNKDQEVTMNQYENGVRRRISISTQGLGQAHLTEKRPSKLTGLPEICGELSKPQKMGARQFFFQFFPPLNHFFMDWKGLKSRYGADYSDAFLKDNISTVFIGMIFIYFVVLSPAITFGALLNAVNKKMTVSLMLVASGFFQFLYTLLSGQPLEVVGITGPVFVVEKVLGSLAKGFGVELEIMRFWIGIYVALLGMVFTIFNGVIIIKHFRRSVEEVYNFLVAAIFILSSFFSMFKALPHIMTPLNINGTNGNVIVIERQKFGTGGSTLFLAFFMANFCVILVKIKRGSFFRRQIRNLLGSFNVPLGIILIVAMERIFFPAYNLPTLNVPPSNVINLSLWVNPPIFGNISKATSEVHGFCFLISLSLFAILLTEVATNSIATTKTERRLVKPSLYSLNFFYILVIFPIISAVTGWPFVSGAMVRSNAHCLAMSKWSLNLPGVPSKITGAVEQRVTGVLVGLLVFLSVFLGSALRYIPMASMYGMFLYMGIMGAKDLVFMRRLINILQRRKYWLPDDFLKDYPTWNIGILILIQGFFIIILITLNCISEFTPYSWATLIFPMFVGIYAALRGYVLPLWPRLNTHLSKMDKKHPVKLYADQQAKEHVLLTVDEKGVNMQVVQSDSIDALAIPKDDTSVNDTESELDRYW